MLRGRIGQVWLLICVLCALETLARAQSFRLDRYAAPVHPDDLLWVERGIVEGKLRPFGRLSVDYSDDPLVVRNANGDEREALVDSQLGLHVAAGLSLLDRIQLAIALPVFVQRTRRAELQPDVRAPAIGESAFGEPALDARVALTGRDAPIDLALAATLRVPAGGGSLAAVDGVSVLPRLIVSRAMPLRHSFASLTIGAALRNETHFADLQVGSELTWTGGVLIGLVGGLGASIELSGSTAFENAFDSNETPIEGTLGARYDLDSVGLVFGAGIGAGLTSGYGAPDLRALGTVGYRAVPTVGRKPVRSIRSAPTPSDPDREGTIEEADACPTEPEDLDGHEDGDGCPDPDNDADGIIDGSDRCPTEPEDADGYQDGDGCPDSDNDADGILDAQDQCPLEAEAKNGFQDDDGCPDLVRVEVSERRIRILEAVHFVINSDRIMSQSHPLLTEMADVIKARPELGRVAIEGYTDDRGSARHNLQLSERRARSVLRFLKEHGVEEARLEARGFGEGNPVADNRTAEGRAQNRRVEFRLVDIPVVDAGVAGASE